MSAGTVTVTHCDSNGTWLVALEGDHDLATAHQLEQQTHVLWPQCTVAVIDLSGAEFIDSGVIRWLLSAECQLEKLGAFTLSVVVGPPESVAARTIGLMGMRDKLACFTTRAEALAQAPPSRLDHCASARPGTDPARADASHQLLGAPSQPRSRQRRPPKLGQISSAMIRVYTEQFGHTPDHAHSHYVGADAVACLLPGASRAHNFTTSTTSRIQVSCRHSLTLPLVGECSEMTLQSLASTSGAHTPQGPLAPHLTPVELRGRRLPRGRDRPIGRERRRTKGIQ